MTTYFSMTPELIKGEKVIATAANGQVVAKNNKLHITNNTRHYIYKHDGTPVGWYMKNDETGEVYYIGEGASPTADFVNLEIADADAWAAILQPDMPDERRRKKE